MDIKVFDAENILKEEDRAAVNKFLFQHLEEYGDPIEDIEQCMQYALGENNKPGGFVVVGKVDNKIVGAVIVNATNMKGYIPENILVYIATHQNYRGQGIGRRLMETALKTAQGDVALHVEPDNPAKRLYEKIGFTNKYLEMRYKK